MPKKVLSNAWLDHVSLDNLLDEDLRFLRFSRGVLRDGLGWLSSAPQVRAAGVAHDSTLTDHRPTVRTGDLVLLRPVRLLDRLLGRLNGWFLAQLVPARIAHDRVLADDRAALGAGHLVLAQDARLLGLLGLRRRWRGRGRGLSLKDRLGIIGQLLPVLPEVLLLLCERPFPGDQGVPSRHDLLHELLDILFGLLELLLAVEERSPLVSDLRLETRALLE